VLSFHKETDTMKSFRIAALGLTVALFAAVASAESPTSVKSGPQAGEELAGPFHPLNINGKAAGKNNCLYCSNGQAPVAMIFARDTNPQLTKLIKQLDTACTKNTGCKMGSYVVFCSNAEGLETKLQKLAKSENLRNVILSIDNPAGPDGYKVAKDADVTVVLYVDRTAKANFSFRRGDMTDKDVATIMASLPKILPK